MKINVIIPFTFVTGGIRVIFDYCNYLQDQGHDVICYIPFVPYKTMESYSIYFRSFIGNILLNRYKIVGYDCKFTYKTVFKISDNYLRNADLTIATSWPTAYDLNNLESKKGKKIYFIQGYETWSGDRELVENTYKLELYRITITESLKKQIFNNFGKNSWVVENGIKETEIATPNLVKQNRSILMMYSNGSIKRSWEGIEILRNINKKYSIPIILFGKVKPKNLPKEFVFYENPRRDVLMELYKEAAIYLFTSSEEAWGLPVMEAMANKCAIVGTNVGCVKELGIHKENMMIAEPENYSLLEKYIEELLLNNSLKSKIQENGYHVAQRYTWENSCKKMEKYLKKIALENA